MGISCYYLIVEIRVAPAKELTEGRGWSLPCGVERHHKVPIMGYILEKYGNWYYTNILTELTTLSRH